MKKSIKLIAVLIAVMFVTSTYASELGIKMANLHLAPPTKSTSKSSKSSKSESSDKAFEGKGSKTISIGLAGSNMISIYPKNSDIYDSDLGFGGYSPISGGLSIDAEFGIHKYVGIGIHTGIFASRNIYGGFAARRIFEGDLESYQSGLYIPVGIVANFHFYQLIEDKTSKDIHGDKLDIYAGANLGSGVSLAIPKAKYKSSGDKTDVGALLFGGVQIGVKYYFKPKFGIFAELGYGKSFLNGGISLKL